MSVYFENKMPLVKEKSNNAEALVIRQMLEDTYTTATPATPRKDGHLRTAVNRRMVNNKSGYIEWTAPYASYQDRGMRADGSHIVQNYTTAGTHARFASESVAKTIAQLPKYAQMQGLLV